MWAPLGLGLILPLPALLGSLAITPAQYPTLFGQPYLLTDEIRLFAVAGFGILLIVSALVVPMRSTARASIRLNARALSWLSNSVRVLAFVTFGAYAIWAVLAIARGLRFSSVTALLAGDPGTMYVLRNTYFETLGGVTTWMQVGAVLAPLAILRAKATGQSARGLLLALIGLSAARALLNSERLALIEIVVSSVLAFMILRDEAPRATRSGLTSLVLIAGAWAALFVTFGAFEYFRSWTTAQASHNGDFLSYSSALLLGYYATALNLAAFDSYILNGGHSLQSLFDGNFYVAMLGPSPIAGAQKSYGLETFTNRSGLVVPYVALGWVGGVILLVATSLVIALWARRTTAGGVISFAAYCAASVGILEIVRIFYFGSSRFLPVLITIVLLWLSWRLATFTRASRKVTVPSATNTQAP
jgi:hypothetical protein